MIKHIDSWLIVGYQLEELAGDDKIWIYDRIADRLSQAGGCIDISE